LGTGFFASIKTMHLIAIAILLVSSANSQGQGCVNAGTGQPCTLREAEEMHEHICKSEVVRPNLIVEKSTRLSGVLLDETGAPYGNAGKTVVQIRDAKVGTVLNSSAIDPHGQFDLGIVNAGLFRLIVAIKGKDGKLARPPLADQLPVANCTSQTDCRIQSKIHLHGTDDPLEFCPPK
jgi:hypothetical protein